MCSISSKTVTYRKPVAPHMAHMACNLNNRLTPQFRPLKTWPPAVIKCRCCCRLTALLSSSCWHQAPWPNTWTAARKLHGLWIVQGDVTFQWALVAIALSVGIAGIIAILLLCCQRRHVNPHAVVPEPQTATGNNPDPTHDSHAPVAGSKAHQVLGRSQLEQYQQQQPTTQQIRGLNTKQQQQRPQPVQEQPQQQQLTAQTVGKAAVLPPLPPGPIPTTALAPRDSMRLPPLRAAPHGNLPSGPYAAGPQQQPTHSSDAAPAAGSDNVGATAAAAQPLQIAPASTASTTAAVPGRRLPQGPPPPTAFRQPPSSAAASLAAAAGKQPRQQAILPSTITSLHDATAAAARQQGQQAGSSRSLIEEAVQQQPPPRSGMGALEVGQQQQQQQQWD